MRHNDMIFFSRDEHGNNVAISVRPVSMIGFDWGPDCDGKAAQNLARTILEMVLRNQPSMALVTAFVHEVIMRLPASGKLSVLEIERWVKANKPGEDIQ